MRLAAALLAALLAAGPVAVADEPRKQLGPWFVGAFLGFGVDNSFSEIIFDPTGTSRTDDDVAVLTAGREIARVFGGDLSFEVEAMYAYHFNRQSYHEFSAAVFARWHRFPWNDWVRTSLGFGLGPRYVTEYPLMETDKGYFAHVLNQVNVEINAALPGHEEHQLVLRLQHRSGIFGLIDGIRDGSDFVTLGYKRYF